MGGDAQIQIHLQLLTRILIAGQSVEEAIAAPRWNATADTLLVEPGLPELPDSQVNEIPETFGHAHCIRVNDHGTLDAAADPRADGIPLGY